MAHYRKLMATMALTIVMAFTGPAVGACLQSPTVMQPTSPPGAEAPCSPAPRCTAGLHGGTICVTVVDSVQQYLQREVGPVPEIPKMMDDVQRADDDDDPPLFPIHVPGIGKAAHLSHRHSDTQMPPLFQAGLRYGMQPSCASAPCQSSGLRGGTVYLEATYRDVKDTLRSSILVSWLEDAVADVHRLDGDDDPEPFPFPVPGVGKTHLR